MMNHLQSVFLMSIIFAATVSFCQEAKEDLCHGIEQCLPVGECGSMESDVIYPCGSENDGRTKICCPPKDLKVQDRFEGKEHLFPDECGAGDIENKIANGLNASIGQFPWMALIGYTAKKSNTIQYFCGGTLINQNYILTAAHCVFIKNYKVASVRLGDVNLLTKIDCEEQNGVNVCGDPPMDVPVEKVIPHSEYNNKTIKHDIALLRLSKKLTEFTDYIKPICLPFNVSADGKFFTTTRLTVSGWGKTSSSSVGVSNVLQYAIVNGWTLDKCNKALPSKLRPLNNTQICAVGKKLQEACKGDSGGPLTTEVTYKGVPITTVQLGVVSFKSLNTCGTEDIPTVFSRVDQYLDWIIQNVQP